MLALPAVNDHLPNTQASHPRTTLSTRASSSPCRHTGGVSGGSSISRIGLSGRAGRGPRLLAGVIPTPRSQAIVSLQRGRHTFARNASRHHSNT